MVLFTSAFWVIFFKIIQTFGPNGTMLSISLGENDFFDKVIVEHFILAGQLGAVLITFMRLIAPNQFSQLLRQNCRDGCNFDSILILSSWFLGV